MPINRTRLKDKTGFQYRYGTDDTVAVYYNDKDRRAFRIISTRDGYQSCECMEGIKSYFISYFDANEMCTDKEKQLPLEEWKKAQIKHVCDAFERNYKEQVENLINTL